MAFGWLEQPRDVQPYMGGWRYGQLGPSAMPPAHRRGPVGTFLRRLEWLVWGWARPAGGAHRAPLD